MELPPPPARICANMASAARPTTRRPELLPTSSIARINGSPADKAHCNSTEKKYQSLALGVPKLPCCAWICFFGVVDNFAGSMERRLAPERSWRLIRISRLSSSGGRFTTGTALAKPRKADHLPQVKPKPAVDLPLGFGICGLHKIKRTGIVQGRKQACEIKHLLQAC